MQSIGRRVYIKHLGPFRAITGTASSYFHTNTQAPHQNQDIEQDVQHHQIRVDGAPPRSSEPRAKQSRSQRRVLPNVSRQPRHGGRDGRDQRAVRARRGLQARQHHRQQVHDVGEARRGCRRALWQLGVLPFVCGCCGCGQRCPAGLFERREGWRHV
ncbi:uncharacterized protein K452DRAFT_122920 [Aplosporella prunicola CBS 121167]|uniref:Uncharacterized protein n=1 Tax=Aplosporella prunicola CBS 121167 TaxID=1176127 RepID=A0A6A6BQP6_9PEZI|nr:uncharacterized protein K452DRAFT_122920 [Aplosporella prunicola CBS 121167]KAF2145625.1 hypothetical protein K452DRAFT_122920 [Aplosporella prunicola CBS 121167]